MQNKISIILISLLLSLSSCDSMLDINEDPNNPVTFNYDPMLSNIEVQMSSALSMGGSGLSSALSTYMHQTVQYRNSASYGVNGDDYVITTSWQTAYEYALEDTEQLIKKAAEEKNYIYLGVAKILKAYFYGQLVDVWGDVPFTEANRMPEIRFPKYDDDATIYPALIMLLDEAIADLDKTGEGFNLKIPAADDLFYGGNTDKWKKLANTIKLKLYTNMRLTGDFSTEIAALLPKIIGSTADDFEMKYGTSSTPENRNPGFVNEYGATAMEFYISPWFYEIMKGKVDGDLKVVNPFSGITDPRIPYYFFNQSPDGSSDFDTEYQDGKFISILFAGDKGPDHASGQPNSGTVGGVYPFGGRYDDNNGVSERVTGNEAPGSVPLRLLCYFKVLYLRAELAQAGVTSENAKQLLSDAIDASFAKVNQVVSTYLPKQGNNDVPLISDADRDTYRDAVLAKYDAANANGKMQIIMTQKWIATFGNNVDQYADYRRTGYPVLYDPNIDNIGFTSVSKSFPLSLPYDNTTLKINQNSPAQKNVATDGVFWDK